MLRAELVVHQLVDRHGGNRRTTTHDQQRVDVVTHCLQVSLACRHILDRCVDRLDEVVGHAIDCGLHRGTKDHGGQRSLDDVPACLGYRTILVGQRSSECVDRAERHAQLAILVQHPLNSLRHVQCSGLVQIQVSWLLTPLVVLGLSIVCFVETTTVQQTKQILDRLCSTQEQVSQHRAVGDTINFTHHLDVEGVFAVSHGLGFMSQRHQRIQRMKVRSALLHTGQQSLLLVGCNTTFVDCLAQYFDCSLDLRSIDHAVVAGQ